MPSGKVGLSKGIQKAVIKYYLATGETLVNIAKRFGISRITVSKIISNNCFKKKDK